MIGADGVGGGLAGVAIEAAGNIDGKDFCPWPVRVDPVDRVVEGWPRFAHRAGAQQGIDEPVGIATVLIELGPQIGGGTILCAR